MLKKTLTFIILFATLCSATELVLQPGSANGYDNMLMGDAPLLNWGYNLWVWFSYYVPNGGEYYKPIMKFDLSSIPAGSTINSAILHLWRTIYYNVGVKVRPYRVLRNWGEGTSCWNTYDGINNWTIPGAKSIGNDVANAVDPEITILTTEIEKDLNITNTIQDCLDAINNYGFIFTVDTISGTLDYWVFASSDCSDTTKYPRLTIIYSEGGGPSRSIKIYYSTNEGIKRGR